MAISHKRWKAADKKYINWYHCLWPCVTFISAVSCFLSSVSINYGSFNLSLAYIFRCHILNLSTCW